MEIRRQLLDHELDDPDTALISLGRAAKALNRSDREISRWVGEWKVIQPKGVGGKGGRFVVDLDDLVVLQATARFSDLHVPTVAIIELMKILRDKLETEFSAPRFAVTYSPERTQVLASPTDLQATLAHGASVQVIDPAAERETLRRRLDSVPIPRQRGRPSVSMKWAEEKLAASQSLGGNGLTPEEAQELTPDQGTLPWRKTTKSSQS